MIFYQSKGVNNDQAQSDHLLFKAADHRMEDRIVDVGGAAIPIDDPPPLIDDQAQLADDDPTVIGQPLALRPICLGDRP